jgi:hypothetical protein
MLAPTRRLAIRRSGPLAARRLLRFRSAQSPRFQETRIGRWLRRTRRPTRAASERTPKSRPRRRERSRGNPPLPVRFTRRCSVSGTSRPAPKSRSRPSAQPRRAGTGDRAWSEAPSTRAPEGTRVVKHDSRPPPTRSHDPTKCCHPAKPRSESARHSRNGCPVGLPPSNLSLRLPKEPHREANRSSPEGGGATRGSGHAPQQAEAHDRPRAR